MQRAHNKASGSFVSLPSGDILVPHGAMIGGAWLATTGVRREVLDPATGDRLAEISDSTAETVGLAIDAARLAFPSWARQSTSARAAQLEAVADAIKMHASSLAEIETLDTGKPLNQSVSDVRIAERYFRYYAHAAEHFFGDSIPTSEGMLVMTQREPYGVVAHITPWNAPISQLARGVAPSLAVGNTVVVKPSELAPLSSLLLAEILRDVLPAGVFNVVPGDGITAGAALASHPRIDHLTFTGSVRTGIAVSTACARNVVATNLELGGKSAAIVFPDADLTAAVKTATGALIRNSGQSCSALTRFIVHRDIAEEFTRLLVHSVEKLRVGPGIDDLEVGPLISETQRQRVFALVEEAVQQGATLLTGGVTAPHAPGLEQGFFAAPTVLGGVTPSMTVASAEVFGPVQCVIVFDDEDEAVRIANGTDYGLAAAVFTSDITVATRMAQALDAGQVQINGFIGAGAEIPFGGVKHSGHGREKGFEALHGYTQLKSIVTHYARG
ncbi:aldehyde dehydrogenase [Cryobacterium sp. Y82]|uniref:aldehyde dehydrogenase family protein n=1 Tax=Cryobacterium sp. Y82 TaxID=2045017 RepID=UPI000CE43C74|nr:aldehyde dehydrogenase family protein [Cryobacterium sp. Y82]